MKRQCFFRQTLGGQRAAADEGTAQPNQSEAKPWIGFIYSLRSLSQTSVRLLFSFSHYSAPPPSKRTFCLLSPPHPIHSLLLPPFPPGVKPQGGGLHNADIDSSFAHSFSGQQRKGEGRSKRRLCPHNEFQETDGAIDCFGHTDLKGGTPKRAFNLFSIWMFGLCVPMFGLTIADWLFFSAKWLLALCQSYSSSNFQAATNVHLPDGKGWRQMKTFRSNGGGGSIFEWMIAWGEGRMGTKNETKNGWTTMFDANRTMAKK